MEIMVDDLSRAPVQALLQEHLSDMYATSPAESVHALDIERLKSPSITFYSGWSGKRLMGCAALKALSPKQGELKSMRTSTHARHCGVASRLLTHILQECTSRGYQSISLETGSQSYFEPARKLYEKFGFCYCGPFGEYRADPNSLFMTLTLHDQNRHEPTS
ncbi:GNAT family N-acetyltransferase [Lacimicrobium sp. SS2-24]|uniref:GNAT family N-acetyltransferase n=1 Tax=Lacimicrobium sp. SS2-24 TaxID=2005569 RepID=UPI00143B44AC|nr:GNAT family N-acetyltransferase [Lacimicrobium sp. SS2-24]